jgi:hypothetical protein
LEVCCGHAARVFRGEPAEVEERASILFVKKPARHKSVCSTMATPSLRRRLDAYDVLLKVLVIGDSGA